MSEDPTIQEDVKTDENDFRSIAKAQLDGAATLLSLALTSGEQEAEKIVGQATMPTLVEGALESAVHAVPGGAAVAGVLQGVAAMAGGAISSVAAHLQTNIDSKLKGFLAQGLSIVKSRQAEFDAELIVKA